MKVPGKITGDASDHALVRGMCHYVYLGGKACIRPSSNDRFGKGKSPCRAETPRCEAECLEDAIASACSAARRPPQRR
jgi:hypothetical protein